MSDAFRMAGIGVVGAVLAAMLRKQRPELSMLVSAATGIVIFIWIILRLSPALEAVRSVSAGFGEAAGFFTVALKVTGIALIAQFCSQACRDAGEQSIAEKIELGGKAVMLGMAVPLLLGMIELIAAFAPAP